MLSDWVVILLPSIQCSATLETCRVIGVTLVRFVEESCACQLENIGVSSNHFIIKAKFLRNHLPLQATGSSEASR